MAVVFTQVSNLAKMYTAFKFEADASDRLAYSFPNFVRGKEGSPLDVGIVVTEKCTNKRVQKELAKIFHSASEPLPLHDRNEALRKIVTDGKERILIGLDFKRADGWLQKTNRCTWQIQLSKKQQENCAAVIIGFSAHPDWWALYPMERLKKRIGPSGTCPWSMVTRDGLATTVPVELWSCMVHPKYQKKAIQNMVDYISGVKDIWENPWTGINLGGRPNLCSVEVLRPTDEAGSSIIFWLKKGFAKHSARYIIQDVRYFPLTSDFKIVNRDDPSKQLLVELKSSQHCSLEYTAETDRYTFKHRQYHPLNLKKKVRPIFSADSGRWAWFLTVSGHSSQNFPTSFFFFHRTSVPQQWFGSEEEWVEWPAPMTTAELQAELEIPVNQANPRATVEKMEFWLNKHPPSPPVSADDLMRKADQIVANEAIDEKVTKVTEKVASAEDIDLPATAANDDDGQVDAGPDTNLQYTFFTNQHQQDQAVKFLSQCHLRRQGLIFSLTASGRGTQDWIYLDHERWSDEECHHYRQYTTSPRQLWQFPKKTKIVNLNFAPLPWQSGVSDPALPERIRTKLQTQPRRSIIIFDACVWPPRPNSLGSRFLVPSSHVRISNFRKSIGHPSAIKLDQVLDNYRVDSTEQMFRKIRSLVSNGSGATEGFTNIDRKDFIYCIEDVYRELVQEISSDT